MAEQQTSSVKWFNDVKGFGFINNPEKGGADLFVHYRSIQQEGFKTLKEGQMVSYTCTDSAKGLQAVEVRVLQDAVPEGIPDKYIESIIGFLSAYDDDDLSDGAWQALIEEGGDAYNEAHGTDFDTNDMFHIYINNK